VIRAVWACDDLEGALSDLDEIVGFMNMLLDACDVTMAEQAVIAHFTLSGDEFGAPAERAVLFEAERVMAAAVADAGVGEVDGDEFGGGQVAVYAYGPDARALYAIMEPMLRELPFRPAHVVLRHDSATGAESRVDL
jgi:hypothetical protein